jgi:hypothetical protein
VLTMVVLTRVRVNEACAAKEVPEVF